MIKRYSLIIFIFAYLAGSQALAAGPEECDDDSAHCAYYLGMAQNVNDGRYVKFSSSDGGTDTDCAIDGVFLISQNAASERPGKNIDRYYICKDSAGKNCELVKADSYTVFKSNGKYSSTPLRTLIDFSSFVKNYPSCNASSKQHLKRY